MPYILPVIILCVYTFTRGGAALMIPISMWTLVLGVVLLCSIYNFFGFNRRGISQEGGLVILMILIILFWNNQDFAHDAWFLQYIIILFFIFLLSAMKTDVWFEPAFIMMTIMALFHTLWTLACFINPSVFTNFVYPIVKSITYYDLTVMFNKGFIMGFNYSNSQDAIYLSMGLIVCICSLMFSLKQKKHRYFYVLCILLMGISLLLTGKRGPVLWLAIGFIVTYYVYNSNHKLSRWFKILIIVVLVVVAVYIGSFFIPQLTNFINRFQEQIAAGDISTHRFELWAMGVAGFLKSPMLGHGWFWFKYNNLFGVNYHVHNCYIQWLCELGIIGSLPFFGFIVLIYFRNVKLIKMIRLGQLTATNQTMKHLAFCLMYQTYFLIYCFAGTSFYEPETLLPWIFSCAMVIYYWKQFSFGRVPGREMDNG